MNGVRGDHPLTDIVNYGLPVFSPEVDALVREVDDLGGFESELAAFLLLNVYGQIEELRQKEPEKAEHLISFLGGLLKDELSRLREGR